MQTKQFQTTSAAVKSVIHNEGILGFYRGYFSTVAREVTRRDFSERLTLIEP